MMTPFFNRALTGGEYSKKAQLDSTVQSEGKIGIEIDKMACRHM